jgi:cytochrome c biogenesis protein CcmG/thiol:disulfide interchange protein DsbE
VYNDTPANAARWIEAMGGQAYPSLLDNGSRTAIDYGLYGVPETFFIGGDGIVAYKHVGPVSEALLRRMIDSLRAVAAGP